MPGFVLPRQLLAALSALLLVPSGIHSQSTGGANATLPAAAPPPFIQYLHYTIEWRLVTAGVADIRITPTGTTRYPSLHSELDLASSGLVSKLYKVEDKYFGNYDTHFCSINSQFLASEGRRRREATVTYDLARNKAVYLERDLVKNSTVHAGEIDIPHCVHDLVGGLFAIRRMRIDVGKFGEIPISDGKKSAAVRVEAQEREDVKINDHVHKTVRYEAFLFNNVVFARKARLFLWLTDDARKIPVQIRIRMNFPVGTITLSLDKIEPA